MEARQAHLGELPFFALDCNRVKGIEQRAARRELTGPVSWVRGGGAFGIFN